MEKEGKEQVPATFLGRFPEVLSNQFRLILIGKNSVASPHLGVRGERLGNLFLLGNHMPR